MFTKTTEIEKTYGDHRTTVWQVTRYRLFGITLYANWIQVSTS
jgi:hypothetical protein